MAKSDLYNKVDIKETLKELKRLNGVQSKEHLTDGLEGIILKNGAKSEELDSFERKYDISLPPDYRRFLEFTNGGQLNDFVYILSLDEIEQEPFLWENVEGKCIKYEKIFTILRQGDGNKIKINMKPPTGAKDPNRRDIMDVTHYDDTTKVIAKSFGEFLHRVVQKIKANEDILYFLQDGFQYYREYGSVEAYKPGEF